ncbi:MAG: SIMPL domain-containing protein [Alphaproteobacteria bacterium]|nr:SIMPL domain-containing protein [Alphaproteobacteria bacterium]
MPKIENLNKYDEPSRPFEKRPFDSNRPRPFGAHRRFHANNANIAAALILGLSVMVAGLFVGYAYYQAQTHVNTVVVKGLAEQNVKADLAIWEMKYVVTGNDVIKAQKEIATQTGIIKQFLLSNGFAEDEITIGRLETNDLNANPYRNSYENNARFILNQTITVKSHNVDKVALTLNKSGDLVAKGIIFNSDYGSPVSYLFTKLNDIKPKMLADATKNAKDAAAQFAKSSDSQVGKIKHANQGVFSILPSEETSSATESQQINKKIRVVSTIEYWLK